MLTRLEFSRDADALFSHIENCWRDAGAGRPMPERKDISPARLGRALPYVSLADVISGTPLDFQYRLIGQHLIVNTGQNLTGKRMLSLPQSSPTGRPIYAAFVKCVETADVQRIDVDLQNMNGTKRRLQARIFPLGVTGRQPEALLVGGFFHD